MLTEKQRQDEAQAQWELSVAVSEASAKIASLTAEVGRERKERLQTELRLGNDLAAAVLRARNAKASLEAIAAECESAASLFGKEHQIAASDVFWRIAKIARTALQSTEGDIGEPR